jgi:hypothetical protein
MTPTESVVIANIMNIKNVSHRMKVRFWRPDSLMEASPRELAVMFWRV